MSRAWWSRCWLVICDCWNFESNAVHISQNTVVNVSLILLEPSALGHCAPSLKTFVLSAPTEQWSVLCILFISICCYLLIVVIRIDKKIYFQLTLQCMYLSIFLHTYFNWPHIILLVGYITISFIFFFFVLAWICPKIDLSQGFENKKLIWEVILGSAGRE